MTETLDAQSGVAKGCTVGVVRLKGGLLFFKNRDLAQEYHRNNITVFHSTPQCRTLKGVNLQTGDLEGVSIGVNRHKICVANTHVVSSHDVPYDVVCEQIIHGARRKSDVARIAQAFVAKTMVQGGKILVASPKWALLVEVLGDRCEIEEVGERFVMANSFSLIPHEKHISNTKKGRVTRLDVATRMIEDVTHIGALKSMLRSHVPERGQVSICNHGSGGGTESSHIIQIQGDYVGWSSLVGYPCENDYHTVQLF